jgi:hypothetical protein
VDPATAAVIVLLACSHDSGACREVRSANTFASIEECREAIKPLGDRTTVTALGPITSMVSKS